MSDLSEVKRDIRDVKRHMNAVDKSIQVVQASMKSMQTNLRALNGTFSSIETHLVKLFEWKLTVDQRLDNLESRQPPAA